MSIKQRWLKRKYEKCNKYIYIVACWAKWGVCKAKYIGLKNEEPMIIEYSDHNGEYDSWYICNWHSHTSGMTIAYSFNCQEALALAEYLNRLEFEK